MSVQEGVMQKLSEKGRDRVCILALLAMCLLFFHSQSNIFNSVVTDGDGILHSVPSMLYSPKGGMWNPYVVSGRYALGDSGSQASYLPALLIMKLFPNIFGYNLCMLLHYWLGGAFTYLYLKKIHMRRIAAVCGAVAFTFCGFMIAHSVHYNLVMAAIYLPVILYFLERYFCDNKFLHLFCAGISFALSISADYLAVSMYIGMLVFPYIIFRCVCRGRDQKRKCKAVLSEIVYASAVILIGGVAMSCYYWIPIMQSLPYTNRSGLTLDQFKQFSLPIYSLVTLVIPYLFGTEIPSNLYRVGYYGEWNGGELGFYIGILTLMFSFFAVFVQRKNKFTIFFAVSGLAALGIAFGGNTPLGDLLYYIPVYNMFRCSCRLIYLVDFSMAVLLALGVDALAGEKQNILTSKKIINKIVLLLLAMTLVSVKGLQAIVNWYDKFIRLNGLEEQTLNTYFPSMISGISNQQLLDWAAQNLSFSSPQIAVPLIVTVVSWLAIRFYLGTKHKALGEMIILSVLFIDLFFSTRYYIPPNLTRTFAEYTKSEEQEWLVKNGMQEGNYRFFTMNCDKYTESVYPMRTELSGLYAINAYGPSWLNSYAKLSTLQTTGLPSDGEALLLYNNFLALSSTRYIVTDNESYISVLQRGAGLGKKVAEVYCWDKTLQNASSVGDQIYILELNDEAAFSLAAFWCNFQGGAIYRVSFDVMTDTENVQLFVDIDDGIPKHSGNAISVEDMPVDQAVHRSLLIQTAEDLQEYTCLRFYITDKGRVEISNIAIEVSNKNANWPYVKRYENGEVQIWENINAVPRARFVKRTVHAEDMDDIEAFMYDEAFDPTLMAIVYGAEEEYSGGTVLQANYHNEQRPVFKVSTEGRALFVLGDTYYPEWKAYVNGVQSDVIEVNGFQRGIVIPGQGEYEIEFVLNPYGFYIGMAISILSAGIGSGVCVLTHKGIFSRKSTENGIPKAVRKEE